MVGRRLFSDGDGDYIQEWCTSFLPLQRWVAGSCGMLAGHVWPRDLDAGGAGSAWRRRPPSLCLLSSVSASVSAVFSRVLSGKPRGCIGVLQLVVAASSFGGGVDDLRGTVASVQVPRKTESRSDSLLRRCRVETSNMQSTVFQPR